MAMEVRVVHHLKGIQEVGAMNRAITTIGIIIITWEERVVDQEEDGLEIKFLRKKTHIKSGVDGGVRFFVHRRDKRDDSIEIVVKRNSDGQSIPKMFAEKLIVQSFVKGMAMGSDHGNDGGNDESSSIRIPNTRIESPTKGVAKIQSVFHKWIQ